MNKKISETKIYKLYTQLNKFDLNIIYYTKIFPKNNMNYYV